MYCRHQTMNNDSQVRNKQNRSKLFDKKQEKSIGLFFESKKGLNSILIKDKDMQNSWQQSEQINTRLSNIGTERQQVSEQRKINDIYSVQTSALTMLRQSLNNRPTFEQMFLLQQEKKHLWELVALKQQEINRLHFELKTAKSDLNAQKSHALNLQQIIKTMQQRERQLQMQLSKMVMVRENIVEELKILKQEACQNTDNQSLQDKMRQVLKQRIFLLQDENKQFKYHFEQVKRENLTLRIQNRQLQSKNQMLKEQLDSVISELTSIKVLMVQKFNIPLETKRSKQSKSKQQFNIAECLKKISSGKKNTKERGKQNSTSKMNHSSSTKKSQLIQKIEVPIKKLLTTKQFEQCNSRNEQVKANLPQNYIQSSSFHNKQPPKQSIRNYLRQLNRSHTNVRQLNQKNDNNKSFVHKDSARKQSSTRKELLDRDNIQMRQNTNQKRQLRQLSMR